MCKYSFHINKHSKINSFLNGMGSINMAGNYNMVSNLSPKEEDFNAIKSDWEMVGKDIRHSVNLYIETNKLN